MIIIALTIAAQTCLNIIRNTYLTYGSIDNAFAADYFLF